MLLPLTRAGQAVTPALWSRVLVQGEMAVVGAGLSQAVRLQEAASLAYDFVAEERLKHEEMVRREGMCSL